MSGQTVQNAGGDGIAFLGRPRRNGAQVEGNHVERCNGDGIDLGPASSVRVTDNAVTDAGACGFRLGDGASRNVLQRNSAAGGGKFDLWESDTSQRNKVARSNHLPKRHRRGAR